MSRRPNQACICILSRMYGSHFPVVDLCPRHAFSLEYSRKKKSLSVIQNNTFFIRKIEYINCNCMASRIVSFRYIRLYILKCEWLCRNLWNRVRMRSPIKPARFVICGYMKLRNVYDCLIYALLKLSTYLQLIRPVPFCIFNEL